MVTKMLSIFLDIASTLRCFVIFGIQVREETYHMGDSRSPTIY